MQEHLNETFRDIYRRTIDFFAMVEREPDFGFKILNSPPIFKPEVLFIGLQPGGGEADQKVEEANKTHLQWPDQCELATRDWRIARKLRELFDVGLITQSV